MTTIWLIGAGLMAIDYAKVLNHQKQQFITIGRSEDGAQKFLEATGNRALYGGLEKFLESKPMLPESAIVAVSIENLAESCMQLLNYGVKKILLEKPGVAYPDEIEKLNTLVKGKNATVVLAYNRRFYSSVLKAQEIIKEDGGVTSFHFEFTEWSHQIRNLKKHKGELENWFLGNSTHVIDTAFFICGKPKEIACFYSGGSDWHPKSTNYAGAGVSLNGALFSYEANWEAPGRWNIDIMTKKHRLIFRPMEKLQIQNMGSVAISFVEEIDYSLDEAFKPGLFLQTKTFLEQNFLAFCDIQQQTENMLLYRKMSGY
jgi:predicted dehydrogenase